MISKFKIDTVILCLPSAAGDVTEKVIALCRGKNVSVKTVPAFFNLVSGEQVVDEIRQISLEDLHHRKRSPLQNVIGNYNGMRVLVTGAGGSIGSELCNQLVSTHQDVTVFALGHGENSIFELMKKIGNKGKVVPLIADICDKVRLSSMMDEVKPHLVLHAAAHKHVGLMERNLTAAVINNVSGTLNLLDLCEKHKGKEKEEFALHTHTHVIINYFLCSAKVRSHFNG